MIFASKLRKVLKEQISLRIKNKKMNESSAQQPRLKIEIADVWGWRRQMDQIHINTIFKTSQ